MLALACLASAFGALLGLRSDFLGWLARRGLQLGGLGGSSGLRALGGGLAEARTERFDQIDDLRAAFLSRRRDRDLLAFDLALHRSLDALLHVVLVLLRVE